MSLFDKQDQGDPDLTVDGFSEEDIERMFFDSVVDAKCTNCGDLAQVEPDARDYNCHYCGALGTVTSPLIKLGLI